MEHYYKENNFASFGFVAAPDIVPEKNKRAENKRFRFYRRFMLSIFGPHTFLQAYDESNSIYILINRRKWEDGRINLELLEKEIGRIYEGDFNIVTNYD
ncbi:MAG: hypothetical protein K2G23_00805 [Muribaculaceae bacterium]|nr:hypothetical protein [Muribaculaceae bacterium]